MSAAAKALKNLYLLGSVSKSGLEKAVNDGVITQEEYEEIIMLKP